MNNYEDITSDDDFYLTQITEIILSNPHPPA